MALLADQVLRRQRRGLEGDIVGRGNVDVYEDGVIKPLETLDLKKEHPDAVQRLIRHTTVSDPVLRIGVDVVTVELADVQRSHDIKHRYGLLTNDAILAATMERLGINLLASNDADFDRVAGLTVYGLLQG